MILRYAAAIGFTSWDLLRTIDTCTVVAGDKGAKRKLVRPVKPDEPLSIKQIIRIAEHCNKPLASLAEIHLLFVVSIGYAVLFHISELLNLRIEDLNFCLNVYRCLQNDQFRKGNSFFIFRSVQQK